MEDSLQVGPCGIVANAKLLCRIHESFSAHQMLGQTRLGLSEIVRLRQCFRSRVWLRLGIAHEDHHCGFSNVLWEGAAGDRHHGHS